MNGTNATMSGTFAVSAGELELQNPWRPSAIASSQDAGTLAATGTGLASINVTTFTASPHLAVAA